MKRPLKVAATLLVTSLAVAYILSKVDLGKTKDILESASVPWLVLSALLTVVTVPPMAWHQFRASKGEPLGFLCMVNAQRDKPQLPSPDDVARLRRDPAIAAFFDDKS